MCRLTWWSMRPTIALPSETWTLWLHKLSRMAGKGPVAPVRTGDAGDGHADLTIEIPKGAVPSVTAAHGDVTFEGLAGPANVNAARGDVKADNIAGQVHAHMGKGDFSAHALSGD